MPPTSLPPNQPANLPPQRPASPLATARTSPAAPVGHARRRLAPGRIWLAAAVVLILVATYAGYRLALRPAAATGSTRIFTVAAGDNAQTIATHLRTAGLIRGRNAFVTYVNLHGLRPKLKVGQYSLAPTQSAPQIATAIAAGHTVARNLVVPDGYTISKIEDAASKLGISKTAFASALAAPHNQSFLSSKPASVSLEGYLFPDSYQVGATTTADQLVNEMLDNFGRKVTGSYTQAFAAEGLTLHQGLTVASIVEREVSISSDRPVVAQIFLKRYKLGMSLGSDVTAQYAAGLLGVPFSTTVQSPYNTLLAPGLPPGPICSPGLDALNAVAHPATTDYLYFLSGKDGKTYYATTYAQHQQNIAKYLN